MKDESAGEKDSHVSYALINEKNNYNQYCFDCIMYMRNEM